MVEYVGGAHGYENLFQEFAATMIATGGFQLKHLFYLVGLIVIAGALAIFVCWKIARAIRGYDD